MLLKKNFVATAIASLCIGACLPALAAPPTQKPEVAQGNSNLRLDLSLLGRYDSGIRGASGAEIVQHDPLSQRLFVVNAQDSSVDVVSIATPSNPIKLGALSEEGGDANSVAIHNGLVVVAFAAALKTDLGKVVFYNAQTLERLAEFTVGALPDMVSFTPNGKAVLVANEAEPNVGYTIDPEGSVSVIDLGPVGDPLNAGQLQAAAVVRTAGFTQFNSQVDTLRAAGVRIYGPGATVAQDLEPEYIAVAPDGKSAWVGLQEANAVGVLDLSKPSEPRFTQIIPLGNKDHSLPGNKLDASDRDLLNIRNWPVKGLYQPDAIASYSIKGQTYYVLANEGDDRNDFIPGEETRRLSSFANAEFDPLLFPNIADLRNNTSGAQIGIGRATVTQVTAQRNASGQFTEILMLGGRSFSIRKADGTLTYDSGADFENLTAQIYGTQFFNASNDDNSFDSRSDNKGPEPEGVALGKIRGRTFAFIGLERIGGVMVYDVTNPSSARYVDYINTRDFTLAPDGPATNDVGAEGVAFIAAEDSPNGQNLIVVGNEVSGTTVIYSIDISGK